MYLGLGLLYVGAVLVLNGIWLRGYIQDREIWVMNIFTGGLVLAVAFYSAFGPEPNRLSVLASAQFLLFAFTYLWVGINRFLEVDGRVHNPDRRGPGMAGPGLGGLGRAVVRLLAAARSGNDAASAVQRRAHDHNRDHHGLDPGLPPTHRSLDALIRSERMREYPSMH